MTGRRWVDASPLAAAAGHYRPDPTSTWAIAEQLGPRRWRASPNPVVCPGCAATYRPGPRGTGPTCADCLDDVLERAQRVVMTTPTSTPFPA